MKNALKIVSLLLIIPMLSGCAVGAATAAYSVKARTADELESKARRSIIEEAKEEIINYLKAKGVLKD